MADRWRIRRHTTIETFRGVKEIRHKWWLLRPDSHFQSWIAERTGTFDECREHLIRKLRETTCANQQPQSSQES